MEKCIETIFIFLINIRQLIELFFFKCKNKDNWILNNIKKTKQIHEYLQTNAHNVLNNEKN